MPTPLDSTTAARALPHRAYHRAQLVLFAGKRDQGKTTSLREYVEHREPRVLALDPFEDFGALQLRVDWQDALSDLAYDEPCRRRVVPSMASGTDGTRAFAERFFEACTAELRDCLLVLDEVTLWTDKREPPALQALVLQGRRLGLRLAVACQRIQYVPTLLLAECTELALFRMSRPGDLDTVAEWTDRATAEACAGLEQGQCILRKL